MAKLDDDTRAVVEGNSQFALQLYERLRHRQGNVFFSPFSISTALAMVLGGARGETEKQIAQTMNFSLASDRLHASFATLADQLRKIQKKGGIDLVTSNSLWPKKGHPFQQEFLHFTKEFYDTSITPLAFGNDLEGDRLKINKWVEARTERKIVELLKPGSLSPDTLLLLVNAIYFKGAWTEAFKPAKTKPAPFYVSEAMTSTVELMFQHSTFKYLELPELQVLDLPYEGEDLSMVILLPRQPDGLAALERDLNVRSLARLTNIRALQEVKVFLPKFKVESEFQLVDNLISLEIKNAFTRFSADFSGMDGQKLLFLSSVIHKAFVEVNEAGTEAAAATAVISRAAGREMHDNPVIPVFRADHPFLFIIRDNNTGSVLFMGRVTNPG